MGVSLVVLTADCDEIHWSLQVVPNTSLGKRNIRGFPARGTASDGTSSYFQRFDEDHDAMNSLKLRLGQVGYPSAKRVRHISGPVSVQDRLDMPTASPFPAEAKLKKPVCVL